MPRIGTLALAGISHLSFSLNIGATGSRVPQKSLIKIHAASKPDAARAGLQGSPRTHPRGHLAGMADAAEMLSGINSHWFVVVFALLISWATVRLRYHQIAVAITTVAMFAAGVAMFVV